jgi:hypothetical protein
MFNQIKNNNMKKRTVYQLIVDRSGSMAGMEHQVISGYNEQLQAAQGVQGRYPDQEIVMGLRFFDHNVGSNVADFKLVNDLLPLSMNDYQVNGTTALLDAIGKSIYDIKTRFGHHITNEDTSVVMIIITDGHENASKLVDTQQLREKIMKLQQQGNWEFIFFGADLDVNEINTILKIPQLKYHNFEKEELKIAFEELNDIIQETLKKSTQAQ